MKKIALTMFLLLCFLLPANAVLASNEDVDGDLTYEEGAEVYIPTEEDNKLLKEKNQEILEYKENTKKDKLYQPYAYPGGKYGTLGVPVFKQQNNYYCGPATVKQVTHFIKGRSNSQSYYAKKLGTTKAGTDMPTIRRYLNNNVKSGYLYSSIGSIDSWLDKVYSGIRNKRPAVLDINTNNISAWPYKTKGHYVNTSGYDTKYGFRVRITDPYASGLGNRWYNARDVYNANKNHFRQAIIW